MARTAEGKGRCAMCGELVTWRRNDSGTLSYFCQDCDFQGYAKAGTQAHRLAEEEIGKFKAAAAPEAAEAPKPAKPAAKPATPPATQPAKPAGFGFFGG